MYSKHILNEKETENLNALLNIYISSFDVIIVYIIVNIVI